MWQQKSKAGVSVSLKTSGSLQVRGPPNASGAFMYHNDNQEQHTSFQSIVNPRGISRSIVQRQAVSNHLQTARLVDRHFQYLIKCHQPERVL